MFAFQGRNKGSSDAESEIGVSVVHHLFHTSAYRNSHTHTHKLTYTHTQHTRTQHRDIAIFYILSVVYNNSGVSLNSEFLAPGKI